MNFQNMLRNMPNQNMFLNPTPAAGPNRYVEPEGQIAWVKPNQAVTAMYRGAIEYGKHRLNKESVRRAYSDIERWEAEQMALPDEDVVLMGAED